MAATRNAARLERDIDRIVVGFRMIGLEKVDDRCLRTELSWLHVRSRMNDDLLLDQEGMCFLPPFQGHQGCLVVESLLAHLLALQP